VSKICQCFAKFSSFCFPLEIFVTKKIGNFTFSQFKFHFLIFEKNPFFCQFYQVFCLSLTISTNFAKIWGKNRQILDITKLEKKKKNPASLAEEAQKEETTWA
jgi:hypothetical protein